MKSNLLKIFVLEVWNRRSALLHGSDGTFSNVPQFSGGFSAPCRCNQVASSLCDRPAGSC